MLKSYEDSTVNRLKVSPENPKEVNDLITLLPPSFQNTVDVRTPNEKYPNYPTGIMVEDAGGGILYFQPYMPLVVSRVQFDIGPLLKQTKKDL